MTAQGLLVTILVSRYESNGDEPEIGIWLEFPLGLSFDGDDSSGLDANCGKWRFGALGRGFSAIEGARQRGDGDLDFFVDQVWKSGRFTAADGNGRGDRRHDAV